jgi:hypothetical protein
LRDFHKCAEAQEKAEKGLIAEVSTERKELS